MKKYFYAAMLLLVLDIMCSCNKNEPETVGNSKLIGTWKTERGDFMFCDDVVYSDENLHKGWGAAFAEDGKGILLDEMGSYEYNDKSHELSLYIYDLGKIILTITKLTNSELNIDEVPEICTTDNDGTLVTKYHGKQIYFHSYQYWYYDKNGDKIEVWNDVDENGKEYYYDRQRLIMSKVSDEYDLDYLIELYDSSL